jgi:hypothetical protein
MLVVGFVLMSFISAMRPLVIVLLITTTSLLMRPVRYKLLHISS